MSDAEIIAEVAPDGVRDADKEKKSDDEPTSAPEATGIGSYDEAVNGFLAYFETKPDIKPELLEKWRDMQYEVDRMQAKCMPLQSVITSISINMRKIRRPLFVNCNASPISVGLACHIKVYISRISHKSNFFLGPLRVRVIRT